MSARHWSDAYLNTAELADKLAAINGTAQAVAALRSGTGTDELADTCDALADMRARAGAYEAFVVLTDAAAALRELAEQEASTVETGEFRALRSTVVAGVAVTEYEGEDTARYVAIGHGQSDQPPELVRVWADDPDDVADDDARNFGVLDNE